MTGLFGALLLLSLPLQKVETGPTPAPGTTESFQRLVYAVEAKLEAGQFAEAGKLAARLPKNEFTIGWDDSKVPAANREAYAKARQSAIKRWQDRLPGIKVTIAKKGDIQISFADALPENPDSVGPAGATFFSSSDPNEPSIEAIIACHRELGKVKTHPASISNEVGFAIGRYFGLERQIWGISALGRTDKQIEIEIQVLQGDASAADINLKVGHELRSAIKAKKRLKLAQPIAEISPTTIDFGEVVQGDQVRLSLQFNNAGAAPLSYFVMPDCGCMAVSSDGIAKPGVPSIARMHIDTTLYPGPFKKAVLVYTNDPDAQVRRIPVVGNVRPVYRILTDGPAKPLVVGESGATTSFYLIIDPTHPIKILSSQTAGASAAIDVQPWEGELADPELGEKTKARKGYKVTLLVAPTTLSGRIPLTVTIKTDHKIFDVIRHTLQIQKGIIAQPERINLGDVSNEKTEAWILVTKPGYPFKITKISCDTDNMTARVEARKDPWEYKVILSYDGKAPIGALAGNIIIETDDPGQPVLKVPVFGQVK